MTQAERSSQKRRRGDLAHGVRSATSEDILVITTGEVGCYWYLMSGAGDAAKHSAKHGTAPPTHTHTQ